MSRVYPKYWTCKTILLLKMFNFDLMQCCDPTNRHIADCIADRQRDLCRIVCSSAVLLTTGNNP